MVWRREVDALVEIARGGAPVAVVCLLGETLSAAARQAKLAEAVRALGVGARLIVVDHNRPRRPIAALRALVGRPWVPGRSLRARWQRLAYPVAREVLAAGFTIERLLLSRDERIQVVAARRAVEANGAARRG